MTKKNSSTEQITSHFEDLNSHDTEVPTLQKPIKKRNNTTNIFCKPNAVVYTKKLSSNEQVARLWDSSEQTFLFKDLHSENSEMKITDACINIYKENAEECTKKLSPTEQVARMSEGTQQMLFENTTVPEVPEVQDSMKHNSAAPHRCKYGLCDFKDILFPTKNELEIHLKSQHGVEYKE